MPVLRPLLLCLIFTVNACGFQPKGRLSSLSAQPLWQLENAGSLQEALNTALKRAGATVQSDAPQQLQIVSVERQKDIYTITRAAKLSEYRLSLNVGFQVRRQHAPAGLPAQVRVERTLPYADAMVLGKQEEEALIWREMEQDAAEQIVRRLAAGQ
ncbi:LPS assembly lipoprotein LptE [Conchiformibius steedae DSM 2580]|uniref:LPS-assembly lipoprotein LptE n=1 Tax=Conchiformibius steedae DSM 2580 TaxID=1121352 RepID=A0AAE9KZM0_9NEIS|nr:LPS assembly lipoprotein LptE [Conchiformibius steedae]QMT32835.1 hypothetical protein H3L98_06830 [Conchiformibius steedae]URD67446.1 LPS assembly lipoprotein LptE [Conchiformibius steedae DSM 2580]